MLPSPQDPTGTLDLRLIANDEIENRLSAFSTTVEGAVSALYKDQITLNVEVSDIEEEENNEEAIALLLLLLGQKAEETIYGDEEVSWLSTLVAASYLRGKALAENETSASGVNAPELHTKKRLQAEKNVVEVVKQNTQSMIADISIIVSALLVRDITKEKAIERILDRVKKVGQTKLNRTSRTEIVHVHQLATITQGEAITAFTGVEVVYRWQTREDSRVRDTHAARNKKLYSKNAVTPLLGEPNCRCRIIPTPVNSKGQQAAAFSPIFLTLPVPLTPQELDSESQE